MMERIRLKKEIDSLSREVTAQISHLGEAFRRDDPIKFIFNPNDNQPAGGSQGIFDPVKFKRILIRIIKILFIFELIGALFTGLNYHDWSRFINDIIIAGLLFLLWGRIITLLRTKKEEYRQKMNLSNEKLKLKDALIFSLLWSDEIFTNIPEDRRRIVVISYSLIAIGVLVAITRLGGSGLMPLALSGTLVLAAVNLLIWVVSLERGEKENLQTELKLAHDVQVSLMPDHAPELDGFDIAGISIPAKEVGGDHYDYVYVENSHRKLAISVFDVSGKGMKAALAAVFTSGAFSSIVKQSESPAEILTRLNKTVYSHTKRGDFVAFLLAMINIPEKTITISNAGQTKPLFLSSTNFQWLDWIGVNFPLGMKEESLYQERDVQLQSGDVVLFFSDGITEAMNTSQEIFGSDRIEQSLQTFDAKRHSAKEILENIINEVKTYAGTALQHDDMTMVVIKVK